MIQVNPGNLRWARKTAGLRIRDAAGGIFQPSRKGSPEERLKRLEDGIDSPTHSQLNKMSKLYHQPVVAFYLDSEPLKSDKGEDYRTIPEQIDDEVGNARLDLLISNIRATQSLARDVLEDEDSEPLPFVASVGIDTGIERVAKIIVETMRFDIMEYRRRPSDPDRAFKYLRSRIQSTGIFVLLMSDLGHAQTTSIPVSVFRGFALADEIAPFVVINRKDAKRAQSFTALHEVVHIWLGSTGVTGALHDSNSESERFCNRVAGYILLPRHELSELSSLQSASLDEALSRIKEFAYVRNISRPMVAYSLRLENYIDQTKWRLLRNRYESERIEREQQEILQREEDRILGKRRGPDPNVVRRFALGESLIELAQRSVANGALTPTKASVILGVSPRKVRSFLYQSRY